MKINVSYPTISLMKMDIASSDEIEINEPPKLSQVKEQIFDHLSKRISSFGLHIGDRKPDQLLLRDRYHVDVTSDEALKKRMAESPNFEVVFR